MDYYDVFTEKFDGLPVVMDNYKQLTDILRVFTDCYEYITECYYSSKLLQPVYVLLRILTG